jgi:hypothetical protein
VWRVGWNVDGFTGFRHEVLVAEVELDLAFEDGEHLLEVVPVRRGAAAGRDVHVDEGVLAGGVVTGHQDRVGVADKADVSKRFVVVGSCDGKVSVQVMANHATASSVATLQAQATVHGYKVVFTYAAVFPMAGAVIAGQLLRRGAVASLEITGVRDKPVVTAPDSSGDPIPLNV